MNTPFRPLVVGPPRSGFVLLGSVVVHLAALFPRRIALQQRVLNTLIDLFGSHPAQAISERFAAAGIDGDLIFSDSFRHLPGGPKWLMENDPERACIRKYIGVRGMGDFSLLLRLPRQVLEYDTIVHSHEQPELWPRHPAYAAFTRFSSVRNPVGILNSAVFSINALTSEYIQKFLPADQDDHGLRERLALYKLTDLNFFEGLCRFYKDYFDRFMPIRHHYALMHWEKLIRHPQETIMALAKRTGLEMDAGHAADIWQRMGHANLTGSHRHNYRQGGGIVGDWAHWLTNRHLEIIGRFGLEPVMEALGYGPLTTLDEAAYTPFQKEVDALLRRNRVYDHFPDRDLFCFAFNKSNIDTRHFSFKGYPWRDHTRVERSSFLDERLLAQVWEVAETATCRLNALFAAALQGQWHNLAAARSSLKRVQDAARMFAGLTPKAHEALMPTLEGLVETAFTSPAREDDGLPPRLLRTLAHHNLVVYRNRFYGIPHAAGEVDWNAVAAGARVPGMVVSGNFLEIRDAVDTLEQQRQDPPSPTPVPDGT